MMIFALLRTLTDDFTIPRQSTVFGPFNIVVECVVNQNPIMENRTGIFHNTLLSYFRRLFQSISIEQCIYCVDIELL